MVFIAGGQGPLMIANLRAEVGEVVHCASEARCDCWACEAR